MTDPFLIQGPAKISFSGGRTSGYMLKRILDAHGGRLPDDVHVLFANTGKERNETLEFIHEIETRWGVNVIWVERPPSDSACADLGYHVVDYASASRDGSPFAALIQERNFLPNPVTRFCTQELKIRVMKAWMLAHGYEHWTNVIGLRADEPRRVSRMRASNEKDRWDVDMPLAVAGITVAHVTEFWDRQPFDLKLRPWEGNCDLCFLKGRAKRTRVMRDNPDAPLWWINQESIARLRKAGKKPGPRKADLPQADLPFSAEFFDQRAVEMPHQPEEMRPGQFRYDTPSYSELARLAQQPMLDFDAEVEAPDDIGDCFCNAA